MYRPAQQLYQSESLFDDDLQGFCEYKQNKIVQNVMQHKEVQDDQDYIKANHQPKVKQQKKKDKQISQQERQARELRLLHARKYFEVIKTMYLQHVVNSLNTIGKYKKQKDDIVAIWISMLPSSLFQKYLKLSSTKNLSVNITRFLSLLCQIKEYLLQQYGEQKLRVQLDYNQLFWSICQELGLACRKVEFFAVDGMVEQVFFKLKYNKNEKQRKRENRKLKQKQLIQIKLEQKREQNLQSSHSQQYMFLQDFQFDQNSFKNKSTQLSQPIPSKLNIINKKRQENFIRRKNYKQNYFQLFDPVSQKWELVNSEILQIQSIQQFKNNILEEKFIVGFYSTRLFHFKKQYEQLIIFRSFKDVMLQDLTMYFCDNPKMIISRRKRIGVKQIMRQIFTKGGYEKHRLFLTHYDQNVLSVSDKIELEYQLSIFPSNKQEMLTNQYFIIPSMLPKYCILDPKALPLQRGYNQEKVYLKRDMIAVTSRNGWVDKGRKVKVGQIPVKKTENKSKNLTELFLFEQTQPYFLNIDQETRQFNPDDQYNNIYVPPGFQPKQDLTIIDKKISYVCNKAKIKHVQLVQGFNRTVGRILPNYIGFLIYKKDQEEVLKLQAERQAKIQQNKSKNREKELISLWNKVFKKIELSQWSKSFQNK